MQTVDRRLLALAGDDDHDIQVYDTDTRDGEQVDPGSIGNTARVLGFRRPPENREVANDYLDIGLKRL
jgi:hypothetical protein